MTNIATTHKKPKKLGRPRRKPGDPPATRASSSLDRQMRLDGFISAAEMARLLGTEVGHIHDAISKAVIPGKVVSGVTSSRRAWYVDVRAYLKDFPADGPSVVRKMLRELVHEIDQEAKAAGAR